MGTSYPYTKLQVVGNSVFTDTASQPASAAYIRGNNQYSSSTTPDYTWYNNDQTGIFHPGNGTIGFSINGSEKIRIASNGNIGINNPNPQYKLDIKGKIRMAGWSDLLFDWSGSCGSPVIFPETDWYFQLGKPAKLIGSGWFDAVHSYNYYTEGPFEEREGFETIKNSTE